MPSPSNTFLAAGSGVATMRIPPVPVGAAMIAVMFTATFASSEQMLASTPGRSSALRSNCVASAMALLPLLLSAQDLFFFLALLAELQHDVVVLEGRGVAFHVFSSDDLAQQPPHDLAAARLR